MNKTKSILYVATFVAISLTFFACSSGGGSGGGGGYSLKYTCQLADRCIQVETVDDCSAAYGSVVDVCQFSSSSLQGGSSSSSSSGGSYSGSYGSFPYEGQTYKTVVIGTQTWFAENLNYEVDGSVCHRHEPSNCTKYGRLYDWETARTVCPSGWHIPTDAEWTTLENYVGASYAGRYLKATSGWELNYGNGEDTYGFAALPSGRGDSQGNFYSGGYAGYWWSATEYDTDDAYGRYIEEDGQMITINVSKSLHLFSVRCVKN